MFNIARELPGRRVGKRCVKPTSRNRGKKKCTRLVKTGAFAHIGAAGENRKPFSGKIGRRGLKPGNYVASLVARDAAGNLSLVKKLKFRVVRR